MRVSVDLAAEGAAPYCQRFRVTDDDDASCSLDDEGRLTVVDGGLASIVLTQHAAERLAENLWAWARESVDDGSRPEEDS